MSENKTGKYLKYAIGEIALVVIGILFALQINNWNERRLNSNKETAILANIHKEFKQNKKQLDSILKQHRLMHINCAKIISRFPITSKPESADLDSLGIQLFRSFGSYTFNPSQTSINALASTSSFHIIKNETLRDFLISWNDLIKDYQEEELRSREYVINRYDPYMSKHFDFDFKLKDERINFDVLQSLEFEYLVKNNYDFVNQILISSGELQNVQATLDEIIELSKPKPKD